MSSYRRTYTETIYYSGRVWCGPRQEGGYETYSGEEQVLITIDVNTHAFDASVAQCNQALGSLNSAVVATQRAQVESKRTAYRKIADSIIKGFFDYVGADLSQKIKELVSKCESLFFALMGHKESCLTKTNQMQNDYNRISRRYTKLFEDLDRETVSRIELLDRPVFQFVKKSQALIDRNLNTNLLGISVVAADETLKLETVLSCSQIKQQANLVLGKANDYLQGTYRLAHSVKTMLEPECDETEYMLPVMFVDSVSPSSTNNPKIYGIEALGSMHSGKNLNSQLTSEFQSEHLEWEEMTSDDYQKIISYFNVNIQSEQLDNRTVNTMLELLNNQTIQTIK